MFQNDLASLISQEAERKHIRVKLPRDLSKTQRMWVIQSLNSHIDGGQLERGRQLLKGTVQLGGFNSVDVGIEPNWIEDPFNDRNWLWRWHQWEFARDLLKVWTVEKDEQSIELLLAWVRGWLDTHLWGDSKVKMAWHDHATALRLRNLFYIWAIRGDFEDTDSPIISVIEDAIAAHCAILSSDKLYSAKTNHGFDQMSILLQVASCCFIFEESPKWVKVANKRLRDEIEFAFTSEGVHVENSPAYHQSMLRRLIEHSNMFECLDIKDIFPIDDLIEGGLNFLSWIVRPDGTLPLIGDTEHTAISPMITNMEYDMGGSLIRFIEGRRTDGLTDNNHRVFTKSGWAIIRDSIDENVAFDQSLHLVLKSGFLSTYHRHDDDTHFVLFAQGSEWLIDGGMYNYQEKDPKRVFVRSAQSHNLVVLPGIPIHRDPELGRNSSGVEELSDDDSVRIRAYTEMYEGFKIERMIERVEATKFIIHDRIEAKDSEVKIPHGSHVRFHFPVHFEIEVINSQSAIVTRKDGCRMILSGLKGVMGISHHVGTVGGEIQSWRSTQYGSGEDAQVLCFELEIPSGMSQICLELEGV